ncbi:MAG: hypothetical protein PF694_09300 [Bacteroidetes bacterium]|jgi:hypothetical protein|nr:hypothetical protein [Bacteroidota bacterium]
MNYWKLIKSRVAGKVPSINQVDEDTLALNQADGKLFGLRINGASKEVVLLAGGDAVPGPAGNDGREIELQTSATHIQWRYVGDESWLNLVALADITGPTGIELVDPPAGNNAVGVFGQIAFDDDYMYLCTGINTWKRIPLMGNW